MNVTALSNGSEPAAYDPRLQTSTPNVSNISEDVYDRQLETEVDNVVEAWSALQLYYTPLIVVLGCCGNTASMLVLLLTKLRSQSSSCYLLALSASDTGYLLTNFIGWLETVQVPLFVQPVVCPLTQYIANCCSFLSAWFVVAFTVERFVAVCYPLHRPSFCTAHRAKLLVAGLTLLAAVINCYTLIITRPIPQGPGRAVCDIDHEQYPTFGLWMIGLDVVVTLVLPLLLIVLLNIQIARAICRVEMVRRTMHVSCQAEHGAPRSNSQQKITKMLLVVSTIFLILNLPFYVMRVWAFLTALTDSGAPESTVLLVSVQQVAASMFQLNFAINFLLYCVSGQNFRRAVRSLLCGRRRAVSTRSSHTMAESVPLTSLCRRSVHAVRAAGQTKRAKPVASTVILDAGSPTKRPIAHVSPIQGGPWSPASAVVSLPDKLAGEE